MKLRRNSKGQMRVVETLLAAFIFISALTFVNLFSAFPTSPKYEVSDLEKMGHNVLNDLDDRRILGDFVYNASRWDDLQLAILIFLPPDVSFILTIRDVNGSVVNAGHPISFGDPRAFDVSEATASVTYFLSGHDALYDPRILTLQLVRG